MYSRSIQGHHVCLLVKTVSEPMNLLPYPLWLSYWWPIIIIPLKTGFEIVTLTLSLSFPLAPSLVRRCALTLNVTSRRCLGMCWMRSSKPSLSADCVRQPQGAHDPSMPPPSLAETQHNHVMKTLRLALSVSPYLLVLRFARFLSWPSSVSHTLLFLCTPSSVVTP